MLHCAFFSRRSSKKCAKGICEGSILIKERGGSGFGYDPLFVKYGYSKSFGELEESIKNRISHRRKALDKLLLSLESHFECALKCTTISMAIISFLA